ncbi:hypothetical protein L873DRAFT_1937739 [Choiromyces venosus 120613-1]|uniref:Uncharacterized protein n=1 Tax=Choiromyces venosus 120613-1 TaxID=1336337 RepID=A0A3N4JAP7_9PEZI|nr:hypothetical protein L873DRAFT_1937739 [Choiromyces venosus 120613-1]
MFCGLKSNLTTPSRPFKRAKKSGVHAPKSLASGSSRLMSSFATSVAVVSGPWERSSECLGIEPVAVYRDVILVCLLALCWGCEWMR